MIKCWNKFLDTCYGKEAEKVRLLFGQLLADPSDDLHGKTFIFYGEAGTGKSSLFHIFQWIVNYHSSIINNKVEIIHDGDLRRIKSNSNKCVLVATNKLPEDIDVGTAIIKTTGNRLPKEEYMQIMTMLRYMAFHIGQDCIAAYTEQVVKEQLNDT